MRNGFMAILAGCLVIAAPASALAGPDEDGEDRPPGHRMLDRLDSDNSGTIEEAEIAAHHRERFARFDLNEDGTLTVEEFAEARQRMRDERRRGRAERMLARMDGDGDGTVTEADLIARGEAMLARLDKDGDGRLTAEEMRRHGEGMRDRDGRGHHHHHKDGHSEMDGKHGKDGTDGRNRR